MHLNEHLTLSKTNLKCFPWLISPLLKRGNNLNRNNNLISKLRYRMKRLQNKLTFRSSFTAGCTPITIIQNLVFIFLTFILRIVRLVKHSYSIFTIEKWFVINPNFLDITGLSPIGENTNKFSTCARRWEISFNNSYFVLCSLASCHPSSS